MNRALMRHGFVLILLALISGLFVPGMTIPRLGLSAHTIGILSGVLLIALAAVWAHFALSRRQLGWLQGAWLYSGYANWLGCLVGAIFGAGETTPVASAGVTGAPVVEAVVAVLLGSVAIASFLGVALALWGLRPLPEHPA